MADLMTIQEVAMDALCGDELPSTRRYVRADLYMKLEAELAAARERATWQPIETAPKDGTEVVVHTPQRAGCPGALIAHYTQGGGEEQPPFGPAWFFWTGHYFRAMEAQPTHWMPLPAAPTSAAHTGEEQERFACGCVTCVCDDPVQCYGCGAKRCGKSEAECEWLHSGERAATDTGEG